MALTSSPLPPCLAVGVHQGQAVAVGGDKRHLLGLQHEQRAIEVVARVLAGDRKLRLGNHLRERGTLDDGLRDARGFGDGREVFARQRRHP